MANPPTTDCTRCGRSVLTAGTTLVALSDVKMDATTDLADAQQLGVLCSLCTDELREWMHGW